MIKYKRKREREIGLDLGRDARPTCLYLIFHVFSSEGLSWLGYTILLFFKVFPFQIFSKIRQRNIFLLVYHAGAGLAK